MADTSQSVTLDRAYFDTLLRRAQFHPDSGNDHGTPVDLKMVTVPKDDYDGLLTASREYTSLRKALFQGGITEDTLSVLINGDNTDPVPPRTPGPFSSADTTTTDSFLTQPRRGDESSYASTPHRPCANDHSRNKRGGGHNYACTESTKNASYYNSDADEYYDSGNDFNQNGYGNGQQLYDHGGYFTNQPYPGIPGTSNPYMQAPEQPPVPQLKKAAHRTINLSNLDKKTTHADITSAISGGPLVDVFLRSHDRTASVSFIHEEDAAAFYQYAKRNDLYILNKRVNVYLPERHFFIQGHIANKIMNNGASRCLVIKNASAKHTEKSMKDDMEHIHNCVVVNVWFDGSDAHLELNSVNNAMFARTCMMSRQKYKGSKIEWDADPCDIDVPVKQYKQPLENAENKQRKPSLPINRFACLNTDDDDEGSDDGTEKGDNGGGGVRV